MREAIIELEVCCVLSSIGVLKLETVILIEELQMTLFELRNRRVVGIKRQLSLKLPSATEYAAYRKYGADEEAKHTNAQNGGRQNGFSEY
jgi:hypothetical protein